MKEPLTNDIPKYKKRASKRKRYSVIWEHNGKTQLDQFVLKWGGSLHRSRYATSKAAADALEAYNKGRGIYASIYSEDAGWRAYLEDQ